LKVLVTGGRDFSDFVRFLGILDRVHRERGPITAIIHGDCPTGADAMVAKWMLGIQGTHWDTPIVIRKYPADWDLHGKAAGPLRNQQMVDQKPDLCVAFPGGRGTADCVRRAQAAGIEILEVTQ
jgi:hypothetical protein